MKGPRVKHTFHGAAKLLVAACLGLILLSAGTTTFAQEEGEEVSPAASAAAAGRHKVTLGAIRLYTSVDAAVGWNNNLFKSPKRVIGSTTHGTVTDLEKSAMFYSYGAGLDARTRLGRKNTLSLGYAYDALQYPDHAVADVFDNHAGVEWKYRPGKRLVLGLHAAFDDKQRNETDIFGQEYLRKYAYTQFSLGPELRYESGSEPGGKREPKVRIRAVYERTDRNYEEAAPPTKSLDFTQDALSLDAARRVADARYIYAEFDQYLRRYRNDLADSANGASNIEGVRRKQNLFDAALGLETLFDGAGSLRLEYGFRKRVDPYEGYNTYTAHGPAARLDYDVRTATHLEADGEFQSRSYGVKTAPVVGPNPKLHIYYWKLRTELSHSLTNYLAVYALYVLQKRDTNVEREDWTTYRDYVVNTASCGVRLRF